MDELTGVQQEVEAGLKFFLTAFGAKRFQNQIQQDAVITLITVHGLGKFCDGVKWAAKLGMSRGRAVVSLEKALPKWGGDRRNDEYQRVMRRTDDDARRYAEWATPEKARVK